MYSQVVCGACYCSSAPCTSRYRLIGGSAFENMYTARLPLFYFCSLGSALEKSMAGNDLDEGFDRLRYAMLQRSLWAQFTRRRRPAPTWPQGRFASCSNFDLPYEEMITRTPSAGRELQVVEGDEV
eukprot:COSAG01_NODE_1227_length_11135_cov_33.369337_6_plen_126_part_00